MYLTADQFLDMVAAVDSLDYWRGVARLEENQKLKWRDLYFDLDSLYLERNEIRVPSEASLRDVGFWMLIGGALVVIGEEVFSDG